VNSWNKRFLTEADWGQAQKLLAVGIDRSSMEKGYLRAGGDLVWVNLTESLLRAAADTPVNFIAVVEEIYERKQFDELLWHEGRALL